MTLRKKVFLRTYSLLAVLTVAICATMSVSLVAHHRNTQKQDGRLTALFIAKNAAKLILWDDRIGLKSLLDEAVQSNPAIEYAFVEVGHRPYVHTMQDGVPQGLLGLHDDPDGATVVEVQNRKGEVVYDIGASAANTDAIVHLGLSRAAIDAGSRGGLLGILAVCLTMLALSPLLAAWVASRVTWEVNVMNGALLLDESRMTTLLRLNQMTSASIPEITAFVLEEAVRLTESTIGYLAFLNEDESVMTMHAWPKTAVQECAIADKPIVFPVVKTGLWGEAVRQRKPIITNDCAAPNPLKKGHPEGHVKIARHMNVPIFDGDRIVVVAGVGDKGENYTESDVRQLTLLMQGMWQLIRRREVAEELHKAHDELEIRVRERTKELQISRDRYNQLAKQSGTFNWEVDAQGLFTYVSHVCKTVLGYRPDELVGRMHFYDLHPEAGREAFKAAVFEVFERKEPLQNLLHAMKAKDGRILWLSTNGIPLLGADGILRGYCGNDTDVTERKRAEEAMRESEEWYKTLFVEALDGICLVDTTTGLIIDCNQALTTMVGRDKAELIGKPQTILHPPTGDNEQFSPTFREHLGDKAGAILDTQVVSKKGEIREVAIKARIVNLAGRTVMHGLFRDITDRKRAEEELVLKNVLLSAQQEASIDGILTVDGNDKIILFNRRFAEMWNVPLELIESGPDAPVLQWVQGLVADPNRFLEKVRYLYDHHRETSRDEIALTDGRVFDRYSAPMFGPDDRYFGRVWYFRDTTDRKRAEQK